MLDITDRLTPDAGPAADLADYYPSVLQTAQYNDRTWGLPWISQPVILYYNPDPSRPPGSPHRMTPGPGTFKQAAAQLTDPATGVYGTSFNDWPPIQMFIWQAGGEVISEDLTSCPIDSPEAIAGAQFYADIIYNEEYAAVGGHDLGAGVRRDGEGRQGRDVLRRRRRRSRLRHKKDPATPS